MATTIAGVNILGPIKPGYEEVLTAEALELVRELAEKWGPRVAEALARREQRQAEFNAGQLPDFLPETQNIREGDWSVRDIPQDLLERRVEITGPVDRKMVINALNTPVSCYMADFEDAQSPTWEGIVEGQINLRDAVRGTISFDAPNGKHYELLPKEQRTATLIARARGWHLPEKHVEVNGKAIPGALFDFALYFHHNHKALLEQGSGPYFYLPKMESHLEARIWAEVMDYTEDKYGLERGTIRGTALIETLPAAFEMDEILYEMRDHMVALNCGRWDYIFSYIKTLREHKGYVLPDRHSVGMDQHFLDSYSRLLIQTCHKRGAMAMGGMAAFIPSKDPQENQAIIDKVIDDKEREAQNGHDGTWIAHPGLADTAKEIMTKYIGEDHTNLMRIKREGEVFAQKDLLMPCEGPKNDEGMRKNIRIAVYYIESWISGHRCVAIYGLMEDAATAEISRAMIWQWIRHQSKLDDGRTVTKELFREILNEELDTIKAEIGEERYNAGRFPEAAEIMDAMTTSEDFTAFLTLPAYEKLA